MDFARDRSSSNLSVYSAANPSGIRKRSISRSPSISASQVQRLEQLCLDQSNTLDLQGFANDVTGFQWLTPQHSPQLQPYLLPCSVETFPQWTAPTPPRSDSELSNLAIDAQEDNATSTSGGSQGFGFEPVTTTAEMSSLGYLLPSQYGTSMYNASATDYPLDSSYSSMRSQPVNMGSSSYPNTLSSSPAPYQSRPVPPSHRRHSGLPTTSSGDSAYSSSSRRISSPYDSVTSSQYSMPMSQAMPSIGNLTQSPLPSPHIAVTNSTATYSQNMPRTSSLYDSPNMYGQSFTSAPSTSHTYPPATQLYNTSNQQLHYKSPFPTSNLLSTSPKPDSSVRVLNARPKPQCFEHGCNGRQFSTFSNLLRHQREKSGTASKSYCPKCGAEFTRTTARNGHLAHDKCTKPGQEGEGK